VCIVIGQLYSSGDDALRNSGMARTAVVLSCTAIGAMPLAE
jgi:hypothetical protein